MQAFPSGQFFAAALVIAVLGAVGSLVAFKRDRAANWLSAAAGALSASLGLVSSLPILLGSAGFAWKLPSVLPGYAFTFRMDRLSAFFVFIISLIALLAAIYGFGYARHYHGRYSIGRLGFFYQLFVVGMLLVAASGDAISFLVAWEIMSVASYFLVVYEKDEPANVKAGTLYLVMTHVGTAFIMLALILLRNATGSWDFSAMAAAAGSIPAFVRDAVFLLALAGFGTKAGVIPLHVWLPSAHPAAPTHVSALMSGVMIKTGILMMIRLFIGIMPAAPLWWGIAILLLGASSSVLGVLYALTEHDIKRLLAYHSIENIGIILLGVGSALVFRSLGLSGLASLALAAALFHTMNHAIFKSLLFFGAGAVISATHTRNIEEYGGLIRRMPQTAIFFLIGSMAISALPPFNGFASEWLTFQALWSGIAAGPLSVHWAFIVASGALLATGGLAAACFVKAFGATFLARPRSHEAEKAHEAAVSLRIPMALLSVFALAAGFFAAPVSRLLGAVASSLGLADPAALMGNGYALSSGDFSSFSAPLIFAALIGAIAAVFAAVYLVARRRRVKIGRTWDCGTELGPRMEITATGFSRSIITVFQGILQPSKQTSIEYRDADIRYFAKSSSVKLGVKDVYGLYLYQPISRLFSAAADKVKKIQVGSVNAYVLYIFLTLIVLAVAFAGK